MCFISLLLLHHTLREDGEGFLQVFGLVVVVVVVVVEGVVVVVVEEGVVVGGGGGGGVVVVVVVTYLIRAVAFKETAK